MTGKARLPAFILVETTFVDKGGSGMKLHLTHSPAPRGVFIPFSAAPAKAGLLRGGAPMKLRLVLLLILIVVLSLVSPAAAQESSLTASCVTNYDESVDYFPDKVTVDKAEGFTVQYFNNYKLVRVTTPWQDATQPLVYLLVQCGTPAPVVKDAAAATIEIPVKSVVSMSTSFLPPLATQGLLDKLVAVDTAAYTNNPDVVQGVADGKIAEVGGGGGGTDPNIEKLIDLQPDLILTQRFDSSDKSYPAMRDAKLPAVIDADFLDTSPLGIAEWGKFISLFFNTEATAEKTFSEVEARYEALVKTAASAADKPTVYANTAYQGTWYMPGGRSYLAQLLKDAGADYLWADDTSIGSIPLDFETVLDTAADADYWVNAGLFWNTLDDAAKEDERYARFKAFKDGSVYSNNARTNANGGSDYYESGYANPDIILADLVKIFHPGLLPDHDLYFYKQIPK
jgi:iron complex transport system substrate-binding protein